MNKDDIIKELQEKNAKLEEELLVTKKHLKTYTAPSRSKTYYENHKEEIQQKVKEYREKTNYIVSPVSPEIIKERNRKAYLKRKEKLVEMNHENI